MFNGNPADLKQRSPNFNLRLAKLEKGPANSPWHLYCRAGIYFHWALVQFRFGSHLKAVLNLRKSYQLLKENERKFPAFRQNQVLLGAQQAVLGSIPDDYKWVASMFGLKGDVLKGMGRMAGFIRTADDREPLKEEAVIIYNYLRFYLQAEQSQVWQYISSPAFRTEGNLLRSFVKANIALNYRKAAVALETLKAASLLPGYSQFPIFDYETGIA
ncbi:MAG: hypothetical protein EOP49_29785, partial [Sphingobacteriales bacterium]